MSFRDSPHVPEQKIRLADVVSRGPTTNLKKEPTNFIRRRFRFEPRNSEHLCPKIEFLTKFRELSDLNFCAKIHQYS